MKMHLHRQLARWVMLGVIASVCSLTSEAATGTFIWTGKVDNDWNNIANWTDGSGNPVQAVPTFEVHTSSSTSVTINKPNGGSGNYEIINVPSWAQYSATSNLSIGDGVILSQQVGSPLNAGTIEIGSNAEYRVSGATNSNGFQIQTLTSSGKFDLGSGILTLGWPTTGTPTDVGSVTSNFNDGAITIAGTLNIKTAGNNLSPIINFNQGSYTQVGSFNLSRSTASVNGGRIDIEDFRMGFESGGGNFNMSSGEVVVSGNKNVNDSGYNYLGSNSFMLANHPGQSTLNISGGSFSALNALMCVRDGTAIVNVNGTGVLSFLGADSRNGSAITINVGTTEDGGRINIGAIGLTDKILVHLGAGTVGAYANWSAAGSVNMVASTGKATTFDLSDSTANISEGRTITLNGALIGSGDMKIVSSKADTSADRGTLVLSGNNSSYSGNIELGNAILTVNHMNALGSGQLIVNSSNAQLNGIAFDNAIIVQANSNVHLNNTEALNASQFTLKLGNIANSPALSLQGGNIDFTSGKITLDLTGLSLVATGESITIDLIESYGNDLGSLTVDNFQLDSVSGNNWTIKEIIYTDGTDYAPEKLSITVTANIPEPSTATLGLLGLGALLLRRRRVV